MTSDDKYDIIELLLLEARHELIQVIEEYLAVLRMTPDYLTYLESTDKKLKKLHEAYKTGQIDADVVIWVVYGVIHMVERIRKDLENLRKPKSRKFPYQLFNLIGQIWKILVRKTS